MEFKARALEPLSDHRVSCSVRFGGEVGEREPEQSQRALVGTQRRVLEPMRFPVAPKIAGCRKVADIVLGLAEKQTFGISFGWSEIMPIPALLMEAIIAEPSQ